MASLADLMGPVDDEIFDEFGEAATYISQESGELAVAVIPERDVEVLDDAGAYVRRTLLGMRSRGIKPASRDVVVLTATGERFRVEGVQSDDGLVMKLRVRPDS